MRADAGCTSGAIDGHTKLADALELLGAQRLGSPQVIDKVLQLFSELPVAWPVTAVAVLVFGEIEC